MQRSKLKEILRPAVREALSDYLKDSEQDLRALQSAHPQLDLTDDMPSEPGSGDNGTRGVKTEAKSSKETPEAKRLKDDLMRGLKVDRERIRLGGGFAPNTTPKGNHIVVAEIGDEGTESNIQADYYAKTFKTEYWVVVLTSSDYRLKKVLSKSKSRPNTLPKDVTEASTTAGGAAGEYQTPYAFSDTSLDKDVKKRKIAQQLGMKIVEKKRLKEEVHVNIVKAVPLMESFKPHLQTTVASVIYNKILDYLLMTDDPQLEKIKAFRRFIDKKVSSPQDKQQLIQVFNDEFRISDHEAAWDYYK